MPKSLLNLVLNMETDMILGDKVPYRNTKFTTESYIDARKIRGAILSALYNQRYETSFQNNTKSYNNIDQKDFEEFISKISLISPATFRCPICESYNTLNKAYATFMECKICLGKYKYAKRQGKEREAPQYYNDFMHEWLTQIGFRKDKLDSSSELGVNSSAPFSECPRGDKGTLKQSSSGLCLDCKTILTGELSGLSQSSRTNVQISKEYRSSEEGKLFEYQVLEKGPDFQVKIIGEDDCLESISQLKRIFIGRGSSRGFGWVRVKDVEKVSLEKYQKDLQKDLQQQFEKYGAIILIAQTHIVDFRLNDESPLPQTVGYLKELPGNWQLKASLGSLELVSGWSYKTDLQKPRFYAGNPGSVYVYTTPTDTPNYGSLINFLCGSYNGEEDEQRKKTVLHNFNQFILWRTN